MDLFTFTFIQRKACYPIYLKYGINRFELTFLIQLVGYLKFINKQLVGKDKLFKAITANSRDYPKMQGYYQGCLTKKLIATAEYISKPKSLSIGITDLGLQVVRAFETESANYILKFAAKSLGLPKSITSGIESNHRLTSVAA